MASPLYLIALLWLGASCVLGETALLTRDATSMLPPWNPAPLPAELSLVTDTEKLAQDTAAAPNVTEMLKTCAAYAASRHVDVARGCYEALLDLHTHDFDAQYTYAQLLHDHFPGSHVIAAFEAAVTVAVPPYHQVHIDAFNTLGLLYRDQLAFEKAASVFETPLTPTNRSHPSFLPLLINLAAVQLQRDDPHAALTLTNDALVIAPENAFVHHNLGSVYFHLRDFPMALRYSQRATELDPTLVQSHMAIGIAVCNMGDSAAAVAAFDSALAIPSSYEMADVIRLMQATAGIPQITFSHDAIAASRRAYAIRLRDLSRRLPLQLGIDPLQTIGCGSMGYSLIYQGGIDRHLREELATIYRASMPSLSFVAPHVQANRHRINVHQTEGRRIRLGVLSAFLYGHTVGLLLQGVLTQLDRATFEIYLLRTSRSEDAVTQHLRSRADHDMLLPSSVVAAQHTIAALALDIVLFSEIGMDKATYFLAFAQLALRSVAFWGHAVTSGISTVDYAITSPLFGTHQTHYTERLYAMQGLTTAFYKPVISPDALAADVIVSELQELQKTIYLVPQTLYKLHPALDPLLQRILQAHDDAVVVFLKGETPDLASRVYERWTGTLSPSVLARVYYLHNMPRQQFLHVCAAADVVLDTFPVGGGRTTLEILAVGTPVIVHEPRTTILQLSAAMYTLMDMPELIAYSDDDYVAKALAVGRNATHRRLLSQRILARHDVLYNQSSAVDEWSRMLQTIVATPPPDPNQQAPTDADPVVFGVYLYLEVLRETFAFQVRASERHRTMEIAAKFGQVHELEPLYVAFIEAVLYKGVSRLDQPVVATLHGLDPDQIAVDIRLGDDIWLAALAALWQHRVQSTRDLLDRILNEWRAIGGQLDTTLQWRAIRDRFPETNYAPTPVNASCVTLVLTTCKRLPLFLRTMASLRQLRESSIVCATLVIDDHSSDDDRRVMTTTFPSVRFLYTRLKGHAVSMNTLLSIVSTRFVLYIEDDWVFTENVLQSVHDALEIFRSHWNDPTIRLAQVLLNDQESGWHHTTPSGRVAYRVLEMGVADPAHKMASWPGFSLNPGVWDLDRLKTLHLRFDTASDVFERAFSLQVRRAGLHVAALTTKVATHIGAPPGSNASAYVLNGLPRRFDALPLVEL